ncbi:MscS Mechanosensitive ion channel [Hymenobacter roseosalivarius DSM 11622]|uniref:MscS Mechanosensitive ion channel n=1 Tax=Hymenobacter roseosalivarius DSM 11622 TaxID=645990 RepID=A0A1W1W167_9BACT|nr:mechanosensitive ion channel family protein [Hymenobacter roseosalivarius]SMB99367.1 MscS Mechanosensitive ion channel [Hymenobacter roseosalivarius DSM 11622]
MFDELNSVLRTYWAQFLFVLPRLLVGVVLLLIVWVVAGRLRLFLNRKLAGHSDDPLLTSFLTQIARWFIVLGGLLLSLQIIGFSGVVGGLLGAAGLSAFLVGFAFKDIAENFLAGVILAFNRPFRLSDTIEIQGVMGRVQELNIRSTLLKTFDGKDVYIPNATILKEKVTNYTRDGFIRQDFLVGIDFDDDVARASRLILEQLNQEEEVLKNAPHEPFVVIDELATSTVNLKVLFWTSSDDYRRGVLELRSRVMDRTKTSLAKKGFSLPPDIIEVRLPSFQPALPIELIRGDGQPAAPSAPDGQRPARPAPEPPLQAGTAP